MIWAYLPYFGKIRRLRLQGKVIDKELCLGHILTVDPFQSHFVTCGGVLI